MVPQCAQCFEPWSGWDAWLHSSIAGLDSVLDGSIYGWKEITVRVSPGVIPELKAVSSERHTPFGVASFSWSYSATKFTQELRLPVGTRAVIHTPHSIAGQSLRSVEETSGSNTLLWGPGDLSDPDYLRRSVGVLATTNGVNAVEVSVGSGYYRLESEYGL